MLNQPTQVNEAMLPLHGEVVTEEMFAQERREEMMNVERDLTELNSLMGEVSTLVNDQQTMIDSIEDNVEATAVKVQKGNSELRQALKSQKKSRKRMCCLMMIILIIGLILALYFGLNKK